MYGYILAKAKTPAVNGVSETALMPFFVDLQQGTRKGEDG